MLLEAQKRGFCEAPCPGRRLRCSASKLTRKPGRTPILNNRKRPSRCADDKICDKLDLEPGQTRDKDGRDSRLRGPCQYHEHHLHSGAYGFSHMAPTKRTGPTRGRGFTTSTVGVPDSVLWFWRILCVLPTAHQPVVDCPVCQAGVTGFTASGPDITRVLGILRDCTEYTYL